MVTCGCALHHTPLTPDERFARSVREYLEMRDQAVLLGGPVPVTADAVELATSVDALAQRIQQLRTGLYQGALLTPPLAARIRQQIAQRLREPDGRQIMSVLADVEPQPSFPPRINGRYPAETPRASTPAALLELLPPLPVVLSYRFVGQNLLLLDRNTGVILDFVDNALPPE
jgi:hypothetical protein